MTDYMKFNGIEFKLNSMDFEYVLIDWLRQSEYCIETEFDETTSIKIRFATDRNPNRLKLCRFGQVEWGIYVGSREIFAANLGRHESSHEKDISHEKATQFINLLTTTLKILDI